MTRSLEKVKRFFVSRFNDQLNQQRACKNPSLSPIIIGKTETYFYYLFCKLRALRVFPIGNDEVILFTHEHTLLEMHKSIAGLVRKQNNYSTLY